MNQPETFWAYLAGLIDGEGHIAFFKAKDRHCNNGIRYTYVFNITNTDLNLLSSLLSDLGLGTITHQEGNTKNSKECHKIHFSRSDAETIIPKVLPYLRIKKTHALLLLEAFKFLQTGKRTAYNEQALKNILNQMPVMRVNRTIKFREKLDELLGANP